MISVVVPIYNEEESLSHFYDEFLSEIKKLKKTYEVIFVDDGSTDRTLEMLQELVRKDKDVRVFSFRKNQGKADALTLGFQKAKGDVIVTLDADLQDKPSEISKLLEKLDEGWDLVSGWRKNRQDSAKKILSSKLFNSLAGMFWGLQLHDYNCGLKVYTKDAAKSLTLYGGMHRFIPLLISDLGFKVTEESVVHDVRKYGKSKYGFSKVIKDLPDIFTMLFLTRYSRRPLHFFGTIGGGLFVLGALTFAYLALIWLMGESIGRRPLLTFSVLLMLAGIQIFSTGFIAELLINQQQDRPHFSLRYSTDK